MGELFDLVLHAVDEEVVYRCKVVVGVVLQSLINIKLSGMIDRCQ